MPISVVMGPVMDQVVVLLMGLPPSTPNPWSAQIKPNSATISPTANVTTKVLLIWGCYAPGADVGPVVVRRHHRRVPVLHVHTSTAPRFSGKIITASSHRIDGNARARRRNRYRKMD